MTPTRTSTTSRSRRPSRRRSTAAWNAATANRSARARTSPPHRGSGSCCAGRCSAPRPAATSRWSRNCEQEYEYDAIDTCAVDGMCQTACPVSINTGDLMKRLRADNAGKIAQKGWTTAAKHWAGTTRAASVALTAAGKLPDAAGHRAEPAGPQGDRPGHVAAVVAGAARRRCSRDDADARRARPPAAVATLPARGRPRPARRRSYFTACVGTMFGPSEAGPGVRESFAAICARAGHHPVLPGRPAGPVLRNPLAVQGNEGRLRRDGRPGAARAVGGQPAGRAADRL